MASRAFDLAQNMRDAIAAWYDDPEHSTLSLPARRLVTIGLPAADCELLAVAVESIVPISGAASLPAALVDDRDEVAFYMRAMVVGLWILRCAPILDDNGNPPSTDDEETHADLVLQDADQMEQALNEALAAGELPGCGGFAFIGWESVTAEGALGGGVLRCQVSME